MKKKTITNLHSFLLSCLEKMDEEPQHWSMNLKLLLGFTVETWFPFFLGKTPTLNALMLWM